jgi:3-oxoacyl-[acyl-carrier-protein] synthase III
MARLGRPVGIVGLGSYVPENVVTNADLEKIVDTNDEWIVERTGIRERRIAAPEQATSDLAIEAGRKALEDAGVDPLDVDLVILATCTPDMAVAATACIVQTQLGCTKAAAFDLIAACSGFVYGMEMAAGLIASRAYNTVLVIGAETLSRIVDWEDRNTCVIFADGAGAAVLQPVKEGYGLLGMHLGAESGAEYLRVAAGGSRCPASPQTVANKEHYLMMNGNEVYKFAVKVMGEAAIKALEDAGITADQLDWLVPHQANMRIIQAAAKRLKMPMEKVIVNVDRYGNTSAASIPIALDEAYRAGKFKEGDLIVAVGFGAGLTWAASVIKWSKGGNNIG